MIIELMSPFLSTPNFNSKSLFLAHRIWMNLRNIFILMTLALGSESENTLGTTGKGLLTTGYLTLTLNGNICSIMNFFINFYPKQRLVSIERASNSLHISFRIFVIILIIHAIVSLSRFLF